jgi:hypothetical protein
MSNNQSRFIKETARRLSAVIFLLLVTAGIEISENVRRNAERLSKSSK